MATKKKNETVPQLRRHGDVVIQALSADEAAAVSAEYTAEMKNKKKAYATDMLAYGEVTGHAHRITGDGAVALLERQGQKLGVVRIGDKPTTLRHEEHKTFNLPSGFFAFTQKRQYSESEQGWETVQD